MASHVSPSMPSHVRGVSTGNRTGAMKRTKGIKARGDGAVATAERSTGINPDDRDPIDDRMPVLTPA